MGMFDRVWVACPECGVHVELQSKAGECMLHDYWIDSLPPEVAADVNGTEIECEGCGYLITVGDKLPVARVALKVG